ncbi:MAG: tetratricopeptide repeat protein [Deinococcota bacterium]|nr:tetratricopeptide repeat protein [Deinococcota bacterium]
MPDSSLTPAEAQRESRHWRDAVAAGQPAEAIKRYLEEDAPDEATEESLRALADLQRELRGKRFGRARQALARVEQADLAEVGVDVARLHEELELLEKSAQELDRFEPETALELLDGLRQELLQAEAETQRGTAYVFKAENERARAHFDRALSLDGRHYRAITNRGNLALEEGRLDEAIASYEEALKVNAEFANALHNLGVAYRRKGEMGKSVEKIKAAQRLGRQRDMEEARAKLSSSRSSRSWLRWALWGAAAAGIYLVLRAQGLV